MEQQSIATAASSAGASANGTSANGASAHGISSGKRSPAVLLPWAAAVLYPFLLDGFHAAYGAGGTAAAWGAPLLLLAALFVPFLGLYLAWRWNGRASLRRLSFLLVAAPTIYVFMGVLSFMVKSQIADEQIWFVLWSGAAAIAYAADDAAPFAGDEAATSASLAHWRVTHGVLAAIIALFVLFHVANHLVGLLGDGAHDMVRHWGEQLYRAPVIEPLFVLLLLAQVAIGARLFWRWSSARRDFFRSFQAASGLFLAFYIVGHMDSVFVFARSYLGVETSFAWARGAPAGLLADPWNIRLFPHYLLGVFFALGHLAAGARNILLAHGLGVAMLNRAFFAALFAAALAAALIMAAMVGARI